MARFDDLPDELLVEIVCFLPRTGQPPSFFHKKYLRSYIADVSLVSRRLHGIAEPFLYRSVATISDHINTSGKPIRYFLRSMISRPALATYVHDLSVDCSLSRDDHYYAGNTKVEIPTEQLASENKLFAATAKQKGIKGSLIHDLEEGFQEAQVILLLHLLPKLQELHIRSDDITGRFDKILFKLASTRRPGPPTTFSQKLPACLQSLRVFSCSHTNDKLGLTPRKLILASALPSLHTMECIQIDSNGFYPQDSNDTDSDTDIEPYLDIEAYSGTSSVKRLHFRKSCVDASTFEFILCIPKELTHFSYEYGGPRYGYARFSPAAFGYALGYVRNSLEGLELRLEELDRSVPEASGIIGSLARYSRLRSIRMGYDILLGPNPKENNIRLVDMIPLAIREIDLTGEWKFEDRTEQLIGVVEAKEARMMPNLEKVGIGSCDDDVDKEVMQQLRERFENVGVKLLI